MVEAPILHAEVQLEKSVKFQRCA